MTDSPNSSMEPGREPEATAPVGAPRLVLGTLLLVLVATGAWWLLADHDTPEPGGRPGGEATAADPRAPAAAPVPVETSRARRGELVMRITATGVAEATRLLRIQSATEGVVEELTVREGDVVGEGALLARLDDAELGLEVERTRERFVRAVAAFTEKQAFLEEGAVTTDSLDELRTAWQDLMDGRISEAEFDDTVGELRFDDLFATISRDEVMAAQDSLFSARADYLQARMRLRRASVRAPFGGQASEIEVVEGARIGAGTTLLTLVDADPVRVRAAVLESEAALVERGRRARVRFAAYPDRTFEARVETVSPVVDPESKTLEVVLSLPNPELRLKPGMFAQISLDARVFDDRLLVPAEAVLVRDDRPLLFVVEGERAKWVYVETGLRNDEWVEILEGVEAGDVVITDGHYTLAHDATVRLTDDEEGAGNPDAAH